MKLSALLAPLLDAKADHELIRAQLLAYEAEQSDALERRRKADAERQSRKRSRDVTLRHSDSLLTRAADSRTSSSQIEPQEQKASRTQGDVAAFRAGLAPDVSEEVIAEFVKVRRKKRGALTGYAATLFREDAAKCSMTVAEAAKECVRSSWITVKPEYFQNRQRAGPAEKPLNIADLAGALAQRMEPADVRSEDSRSRLPAPVPNLSLVSNR